MRMLDPLSSREFVQAVRSAKTKWKNGLLKEGDWDSIVSAFESLDVVFEDDKPHAKLANDLLTIGQAIVRGEGEVRQDGVLVMGDRLMELGEQCYAYSEEKEGEEDGAS